MSEIVMSHPFWTISVDVSVSGVKKYVAQCYRRYRTRQQLAKLPEERLSDLGLSVEQVREELNKPFWR